MIDEYAMQRQLPLDETTYGKCGDEQMKQQVTRRLRGYG